MRFSTALYGLALVAYPFASAVVSNTGKNSLSFNDIIPDKYIVRYKANTTHHERRRHEEDVEKRAKHAEKRGLVDRFDIHGLQGYIVEIPLSDMFNITGYDLIDTIEKDALVKAAVVVTPSHPTLTKRTMIKQHHAPWGLGRISHRVRNNPDYFYSDSAGKGVRVYVLDTGIRTSHAEFAPNRAVWGTNFIPDTPNADEDGHGTHVAGTIAGKTFGVAKKATVVAVKVLDRTGSGYMSYLLQGLNWAVADAKKRGIAKKAVINMSLGGDYTEAVNAGVKAATDAGMTVVVAAGNDDGDAKEYSPGSASTAITVGASDTADMRAYFSNYGGGVDIFAPGVGILSASKGGDKANMTMSGTSMAAPHVAGLAAYFIAREHLSGYAAVSKRILNAATKGVRDRKGSADRIAYNAHGV